MKDLFKKVLGDSPVTSIMGYLLAVLTVVHPMLEAGTADPTTILMAVVTAAFGRKASDGK